MACAYRYQHVTQLSIHCAAGPDRVASSAPGRRELCEVLREDLRGRPQG